MDMLDQCREWVHQGKYSPVVELLEDMPEIARSLELDLLLCEAYFGMAKRWEDRPIYRKAVDRLLLHKEEMTEDFWWNVRLGQAYFNTNQYGRSLLHYRKAMQLKPNLLWVDMPVKECVRLITHPPFNETFAKRVEGAWQAFECLESDLRSAIHGEIKIEPAREAFRKIDETLEIACENLAFSVAGGGEKAELILSLQGDWCRFFELVYLKSQAPKIILENWDVVVGRQPTHQMRVGIKDVEVEAQDVKVWLDKDLEGNFRLSVFCEKLASLVENDRDQYFWAMVDLIENTIGELPRMRYFYTFEVLDQPKNPASIALTDLPDLMKKLGFNLSLDPSTYVSNFSSYLAFPRKERIGNEIRRRLRDDIFTGSTNCAQLLEEYSQGKDELANGLIADGAVPCFVFFTPPYGTNHEKNLKMLEELQKFMVSKFNPATIQITGTAKGRVFWYVDFIAWSLPGALEAAEIFFQRSPRPNICGFQVLHTESKPVFLAGEDKLERFQDS